MERTVKLNELDEVLTELDYPISRERVREHGEDVTLVLADGEVNVSEVLAESSDESFESVDDLESEILNLLPREGVGEPYQSEGEG